MILHTGCAYDALRWISRDPIGERGGINLYDYVANNPINEIDPLGLWQITIGGGDVIGGIITFGNNGGSSWLNGQWNFGGYAGVGEGLFGSFDPHNSGCHESGFEPGVRGIGGIGLGEGVDADSTVGSETEADVGVDLPGSPNWSGNLHIGDGNITPGSPTYGGGAGTAAGAGGVRYW